MTTRQKKRIANSPLPIVPLGIDAVGNPVTVDLRRISSLLVGGGQGQDVPAFLRTIVGQVFQSPMRDMIQLIFVESHVDTIKGLSLLEQIANEADERLRLFKEEGVKGIDAYNNTRIGDTPRIPYILVIVPELLPFLNADAEELEDHVMRLSFLKWDCGIHLVLATETPTMELAGHIHPSVPDRIVFQTRTGDESRCVLGGPGGERLEPGEALFLRSKGGPTVLWSFPQRGTAAMDDTCRPEDTGIDTYRRYVADEETALDDLTSDILAGIFP